LALACSHHNIIIPVETEEQSAKGDPTTGHVQAHRSAVVARGDLTEVSDDPLCVRDRDFHLTEAVFFAFEGAGWCLHVTSASGCWHPMGSRPIIIIIIIIIPMPIDVYVPVIMAQPF